MDFDSFSSLVIDLQNEPSYNQKSVLVGGYLDLLITVLERIYDETEDQWRIFLTSLRLLMTKADSRIFNMDHTQMIKYFSKIFKQDRKSLTERFNTTGELAEVLTERITDELISLSRVNIQDVDDFLTKFTKHNSETSKIQAIKKFYGKGIGLPNSSITFIRLLLKDLRNGCGISHILNALHPEANSFYQECNDLERTLISISNEFKSPIVKNFMSRVKSELEIDFGSKVISPMLAEAIKKFETVYFKKNKPFHHAFNVEIKYDGERIQIHKVDGKYSFYSRNLKPVCDHKVLGMDIELDKIFKCNNFVLDSEIVMVNEDGKILPFGTLGKNKAKECMGKSLLFIFDCIQWDNEVLMDRPVNERKSKLGNVSVGTVDKFDDGVFLSGVFTESDRIRLSPHFEYNYTPESHIKLLNVVKGVLGNEMEGLILKPLDSLYVPGKRRWFKVKKDYISDGKIADSLDLVILGCSYGTGKMASIYSIFLMGCWDADENVWKTVTKVHTGLTYEELASLNKMMQGLVEIYQEGVNDVNIKLSKVLRPMFIAKDPFTMPVLEIISNEFTKSKVHSCKIGEDGMGISLRFPRINSIRVDKNAIDANSLESIIKIYENSKATFDKNFDEFIEMQEGKDSKESQPKPVKRKGKVATVDKRVKMKNEK